MAREIKFRAWDSDIRQMIVPHPHSEHRNVNDVFSLCVYPLMQYTGLKDKNGKEIYEGDLLRNTVGKTQRIGEVRAEPGGFQIFTRDHWPDWYQDYPMRSVMFGDMEYEVIGNIYEEP
jgi:uncharacterized phage protein (TIGR01671 family)